MVHSLATTGGNQVALPSNWGTAPSGASMSNPFAAFSIQIGSAGVQAGILAAGAKGAESLAGGVPAAGSLPLQRSKGEKLRSSPLWTSCLRTGGTSLKTRLAARTVVQVLDKKVETMLDGCAGANHITEELLMGMLNRAAELGIETNDRRFPVVRLEKWVHPSLSGIASGARPRRQPVSVSTATSPWSSPLKKTSSSPSGGMRRRPPTALCRRWFSQWSAPLRRSHGSGSSSLLQLRKTRASTRETCRRGSCGSSGDRHL